MTLDALPATTDPGQLYFGHVMHARLKPFGHKFKYRVFSMLVDIDKLDELAGRLRLFSLNKGNIFSFYNKDHGARDGKTLRPWVEDALEQAGIDCAGGPIRLLCYPRMFGYVFNPLSVYYCYDPFEKLQAIVYEVSNTFGEWHAYVAPARVSNNETGAITHSADKVFYVSPFMRVAGTYRFRITDPAERISVAIRQSEEDGAILIATFDGEQRSFSDSTLIRALVSYPLMTVKVIGAIHWEALKLWFKGAIYVKHPAPPKGHVSLGR